MSQILEAIVNFFTSALASAFVPAVILLVIGVLAIQIIMKIVKTILKKSKLDPAAHGLIKSLLQIVLYILLALTVASKLGIDVTSVVALASVLTLAVSLALQNALANIIGGFTLLYTKPFSTGDFVEIAGQSGSVQAISLSYTKLATADNKIVSIPNSAVVAAQIVNYTVSGTRRVDITVSASYADAPEAVLEALREAGAVETALEAPAPFAAVKEYGESAIVYVLQVWCATDNYWTTLFTANQNIKKVFDAKGISMTFPHLNVHLDK